MCMTRCMTRMTLSGLCVGLLLAAAWPPYSARADSITLSTLEWAPFTGTGADLPGQGMTTTLVRQVVEAMGYTLVTQFMPWKRAVAVAEDGRTDGYFPEYPPYPEVLEKFACTASIGESELGFVQHSEAPVTWTGLEDLTDHVIGTVDGYLNEERFDAWVADGRLTVSPVRSDELNLRKVKARRIPLAIMDRAVMRYLLFLEGDAAHPVLEFNPKPLAINTLHVCFTRANPDAEAMVAAFDAALAGIDVESLSNVYLEKLSVQ